MAISIDNIGKSFYSAFQQNDVAKMKSLYHPDLRFEDPAFGQLDYQRATFMWQMLCESAKDLKIDFTIIDEKDDVTIVQWVAYYTFSATKRPVKNIIIARLQLKDGLIIDHHDNFDLHKWAKQALGFKGWLLGGTSYFKNKLHKQTNRQLDKYIARQQPNK
jgi:hypothetical protein